MSPALFRTAALAVLYFHFAVVVFNLFWLVIVPIGAWQEWPFVRNYWWRAVHLLALVLVAIQAALGRLCFLTTIQDFLQTRAGGDIEPPSLLTRLIERAVFWPIPDWVFAPLYLLALTWAAILWITVPPVRASALKT